MNWHVYCQLLQNIHATFITAHIFLCQGRFYPWHIPMWDFSEEQSQASAESFKKISAIGMSGWHFSQQICVSWWFGSSLISFSLSQPLTPFLAGDYVFFPFSSYESCYSYSSDVVWVENWWGTCQCMKTMLKCTVVHHVIFSVYLLSERIRWVFNEWIR